METTASRSKPSAQPAAPALTVGSKLGGGRYQIDSDVGAVRAGQLYRATDQTSNKAVDIIALSPALLRGADLEAVEATITRARALAIDGLAVPIDLGTDGDTSFLVSEGGAGNSLAALLARKRSTGAGAFAPRAAGNLIGRLCTIVGALHAAGLSHGFLGLETVRVDRAGNVHVIGLGLSPLAANAAGLVPNPSSAPELASGGATAATDLYAIGAILYEVLVGDAPVRGCSRPSELIEGLSGTVDQVIAASMHPQIKRRPPSAEALKDVLQKALREAGLTVSAEMQAAKEPAAASRPSLAESIGGGAATAAAAPTARSSGQIAAAIASDDEAWLISKAGLDYGPFSMAKVFDMIRTDEILPGHLITNKHTGERAPVEEHPLLAAFVDEAKAARDERRRAHAEVAHSKTEKRRGAALYGFIIAGVIALGGGAYFVVDKLSSDSNEKQASIDSLEEGELQATISFPTREKQRGGKRAGGKRSGGKRSGGSSGGNQGGWDDAVDLGDASEGGGDERLDDSQINPVVQRAAGRLGGCLRKAGGGRADIRFIVKGTGRVSYVGVNGKTNTPLASCVRGVMKGLKFPSYDGNRTRANFSMAF